MNQEWEKIVSEMLNTKSICSRCKVRYLEIDNIGKWECSQHSLPLNSKGFYLCCGTKYGTNGMMGIGCVKADHNCDNFSYNNEYDFPMPVVCLSVFQPTKDSVLPDEETEDDPTKQELNYVYIRRYDWVQARKKEEGTKLLYKI